MATLSYSFIIVSGSDDIELATGMVTIGDNDIAFGSRDRIGSGAKNVLGGGEFKGADYMMAFLFDTIRFCRRHFKLLACDQREMETVYLQGNGERKS